MNAVTAHPLAPGVPGAPLVVFAHGLEDSWTSWQPLAAELDPDWRLVALDPHPGRTGRTVALVCPLYREPRHPVTWRMFDRSRATFVRHIRDGVQARMGGRADSMEPGLLEAMIDMAVDRVGPAGFLTVFDQFARSADLPLGNVELPTLVLAGASDPTLSREAAAALAGAMPGASLRIHDGYDHFCHVRHAGDVAAQVAGLVAAARATTRTTGELR